MNLSSYPLQQFKNLSISPTAFVWFLLVDADTGLSYKGTSATKVSVDVSADVDDFRDAVKAKHINKLSVIDAADLIVYRNKAAFDSRNDKDEKEESLNPTEPLGVLGSMKEMLIVAVPAPVPSYQTPSFPRCEQPFFNKLLTASKTERWITFEESIPSTSLKKLYIRESYETIAENISSGINKVIITGTPGIGKSLFLIYLLHQLVERNERVLFLYHPNAIYYDGKGGVFSAARTPLPALDDLSFWNDTLWCLFDAKNKRDSDLDPLPYERCTFVLSTSPRREMVNDFKKSPDPQVFYMPLWKEHELRGIAPLFSPASKWKKRFKILGGIPRFVFESTRNDPTDILESACEECSLDECTKKIGLNSAITEKSKVVHTLVHVDSLPPYTKPSVDYASKAAMNIIIRNKGEDAKLKMRQLLAASEGHTFTAALCGYIFEPYAIEKLEQGGTFKIRQLVHGNTRDPPEPTTKNIPPSTKMTVDTVEKGLTHNQLFVPKTKNFVAIDAWMPKVGAFQMTVGKKHDIHGSTEGLLKKLPEGEQKLYFLVPPLYFYKMTKQTPYSIDQYAMEIPYPEP